MNKNLNEISSGEFRGKLKSLGHSEKGSELTSGGDLKSDLLTIFSELMDEFKKTNSSCNMTFTAGNDKFHQSRKSRHTAGEAIDVVLPSSCHGDFIKLLEKYKSKYNGFSFIDEYRNPSKGATGGHFHVSYRKGSPEGGVSKTKKSISGQLGFKKYSGKPANNIKIIIDKLKKEGITDPIAQIGILSTIGKESGFVPQNEFSYCNTSDGQLVKIFGKRGRKCGSLKCDDPKFFDCIYGSESGMSLGNMDPGDGYKYRGRGFNQITGRSNYRSYGYENNPEALNNPEGAADAAIKFLTKGKGSSLNNKFKSVDESIKYFVDINAGGSASGKEFSKAKNVAQNFTMDGTGVTDTDFNLADTGSFLDTTTTSSPDIIDVFRNLGKLLSPDKALEITEDVDRMKNLMKKIL